MARHINLLDPPQKIRSPWETALKIGVPIALVLLVMGTWAAVVRIQVGTVKQQVMDIEAKIRPVREQLTQIQTGMGVDQVNATLRERLERAEAQLKARTDIQTALRRGDLGSTQGFSEFMRAFARQTVTGLWLTGLKLENGGHDITLAGRALSAEAVAVLVRQLRAESALKGRSIATLHVAPVPQKVDESSAPVVQPHVYEFEISSVSVIANAAVDSTLTEGSARQEANGVLDSLVERVLK